MVFVYTFIYYSHHSRPLYSYILLHRSILLWIDPSRLSSFVMSDLTTYFVSSFYEFSDLGVSLPLHPL